MQAYIKGNIVKAMLGQHRLKYLTVAAAVWIFVGSALTMVARAQGAASPAPSAISSSVPPGSAVPTPTATSQPATATAPTATATAQPAAANTLAPLSRIDHAAWVSSRPSDLRPGDHVLVIQRAPAQTAAAANAPPAPASAIPQAASRPEARQTPAATVQLPPGASPAAQPQPAAVRTPSTSALAANHAPAPTPGLSPIDHMLLVSVHPPGAPGAATDHVFPAYIDHRGSNAWTPGRQMLASLRLPEGHHLTEGQQLLMETPDDSCRDPVSWSLIVRKSSYLVDVYYKGKHFDSFPAVFGRNPDHSAKQWEGDLRTPEGNYTIIEKYYNPRWKWFLRLNYPNYSDRTRYESQLGEGLVPVIHGHRRPLGGAIGIHGTDRPRFNRLHLNWTLGCISVENDAIEELERILPVGTPVIINR